MFLPDWKEILTKAWSIKLIILAAIFSGLSVFVSQTNADVLGLSPAMFAGLAAIINAGAFVARILAQKETTSFLKDTSGAVKKGAVGLLAGSAVALAATVSFVGGWEGRSLVAYQDVVGVWTICDGETLGVKKGDVRTADECDEMFEKRLIQFEAELDKCLFAVVPVPMKIALNSWAYNVGSGAACRSTLVKLANAGDLEGACHQLPRWNRAGGRVIKGLSNRRGAERALCLSAL
ncbi:lysozyme [Falsihalocynthiibacter sp. S25ZX9]|uniref:lysozyme n=1 Tax=Falsihalocynthiibacter sp. S25ZX9 TaxID=3240870 RepID=UPI0035102CBB